MDNATLAELEGATDEGAIAGCEMRIATRSRISYPEPELLT